MIPISLCWDTRKRSALLKWNGLISLGWQNGKMLTRILGLPIPLHFKKKGIQLSGKIPIRWIHLKGMLSFFSKWKLRKVEGTLSFPDPMVNGVLYGWMSAIQSERTDQKNRLTINFLNENWCKGEVILSLRIFFQTLRGWIIPLVREMRGRKPRKGGES